MMIREKKFMIILVICTLITFLFPSLYSFYKQEQFENSIKEWRFKASTSEVSQADFAKMFVENNLSYPYMMIESSKDSSTINIDYVKLVLASIYEDESLLNYIDILLEWPIVQYENMSFIHMVNHKPVVFNLVGIAFCNDKGEILEIGYEQRTGTILKNSIYVNNQLFMDKFNLKDIPQCVINYCENHLELNTYNYDLTITDFDENYYSMEFNLLPMSSYYKEEDIN